MSPLELSKLPFIFLSCHLFVPLSAFFHNIIRSIHIPTLNPTYSQQNRPFSMRRPGPLQDLPLDQFLPPNPNVPISPFKSARGIKRSLPPGPPTLFSPAKRRILNAEGICSPELTLKSPVSMSSRARQSPARFADLVRGTDSPARKLDFGLPKNHSQSTAGRTTVINSAASSQFEGSLDMTPTRISSTSTKLAPSPEIAPKASSSSSLFDEPEMDDYFSPHLPRHSSTIPTMIPRELPPPPDRQSSTYPGFDVYMDTHIPLLHACSTSTDSTDSGTESMEDRDECKENIPPRRKVKKAMTAPTSSELIKTALLSPEGKKRVIDKEGRFNSTPATPKKARVSLREDATSPTPRRPGIHDLLSPALSAVESSKKERMERRRMLEDEVDEGEDETL